MSVYSLKLLCCASVHVVLYGSCCVHTHTGADDQRRDTCDGVDRANKHHRGTDVKIGLSTVVISEEEHRSKLLTTIVVSDGIAPNEEGE